MNLVADSEKEEQLSDDVGEVCKKRKELIKGVVANILKYDQMDIEDCYQEICIKVKRYKESCKITSRKWPPSKSLICVMAKRTALDMLKKSNRFSIAKSKAKIEFKHLPKPVLNIDDYISGKEAWKMADQKCQKLFTCKYDEGLTHEEIGLVYGITKGAVSQRLTNCLATLRGKIGIDI